MKKTSILLKKLNKKNNQTEWALVSKDDPSKILKWFGAKKPSEQSVEKEEKRVLYFKNIKKAVLKKLAKSLEEKAQEAICESLAKEGYRCQTSMEDGKFYLWIDLAKGSTTITMMLDIVKKIPSGIFAKMKGLGKVYSVTINNTGELMGEKQLLSDLSKKING